MAATLFICRPGMSPETNPTPVPASALAHTHARTRGSATPLRKQGDYFGIRPTVRLSYAKLGSPFSLQFPDRCRALATKFAW